jgi:hypothetical protein
MQVKCTTLPSIKNKTKTTKKKVKQYKKQNENKIKKKFCSISGEVKKSQHRDAVIPPTAPPPWCGLAGLMS